MRVLVEGYDPVEAPLGGSLLEVCEGAGIPMDSACGGFAACNSCRVEVLAGGSSLNALQLDEEAFLDAPDQRLGCQARPIAPGELRIRLAPGA
ncbi:MAG: 2Fe-2S iron-sulfur cluster-binding protein [Myxococcota bacterium]